ncbi:hypothetical protein Tco_1246183 [Tanacetum coccineum]
MTTLADKSLLSGGDNKPPMLEKHLYDSWKSRMELYMINRPHGRMILASVEKDCDIKAINIILQGLPTEIYDLEHKCKLYDEFDKFTYKKRETLHEYYLRFTLLLNDMNIYKMPLEQFQVNTKFLNTLPDEWSKFVTDVKLVKDLHTTNVDQLHAYLEQHERHANEVCLMHERNSDPLALFVRPYQTQQFTTNQSAPLSITYPTNEYQSTVHHNVYSPQPSILQLEYAPIVYQHQQLEFSQPDSSLVVPVFQKGDDPIDAMMPQAIRLNLGFKFAHFLYQYDLNIENSVFDLVGGGPMGWVGDGGGTEVCRCTGLDVDVLSELFGRAAGITTVPYSDSLRRVLMVWARDEGDGVALCLNIKINDGVLFPLEMLLKNNVLFTDTEYLVLSSDFKLLDESQVLLRVPRKDNIYSVDLKSVVPTKGLTCLFAKATIDESNLGHRKLIRKANKPPYGVAERRNQNTNKRLQELCKFDRKAYEGFFIGYSVVSKAMQVFNKRGKPGWLKETLNIRFLEKAPNGTRDNIVVGQAKKKKEHEQEYILIPFYTTDPLISEDPKGDMTGTDNQENKDEKQRQNDQNLGLGMEKAVKDKAK